MPPDIQGSARKFIPNNPPLLKVVTKVLQNSFRVRTLPLDLVKLTVRRAFELERDLEMEVQSSIFEEKLSMYVNQIKPRFMSKINQLKNQSRKW